MEKQNASLRAKDQDLITPLNFCSFQQVTHRVSVSDLFKAGPVPGLYVLAFSDGAFYAGKTNDVKQRFCSHARNHGDIDYLSFKPLAVKLQDAEEKPLIQLLKKNNFLLRNIQFISNPDTPREIDFMIPPLHVLPVNQDPARLYIGFPLGAISLASTCCGPWAEVAGHPQAM